ncbi:MAG: hypothetical protein ACFFCM_18970 [Promethearchaeota archaeon]
MVVVTWFDIEDDSHWKPIELVEIEQAPVCKTVGWFINADNDCVRLAYSASGTEETRIEVGRTLIPKAVVKNIEKVRDDELGVEI